jgi:hypothetical protein
MANCKLCWVAAGAAAIGFASALMLGAGEPDKGMTGHAAGKAKDAAHQAMDPKAMMEACEKAGTPGEMHKKLEYFAGKWDTECSEMWMGETTVTKGTCFAEKMWDGRYIKSEYKGSMNGKPFTGISYTGYNNAGKEFQSTWMDSMGTAMMLSTGKMDDSGKSWTYTGECNCPMTGQKMGMREVVTIIDANSYKFDMYMPGPEGKEMLGMTIMYKRAK